MSCVLIEKQTGSRHILEAETLVLDFMHSDDVVDWGFAGSYDFLKAFAVWISRVLPWPVIWLTALMCSPG